MRASSFLALLATVLALTIAVVSAQTQPSTPPPCYQEKCSGLINIVGECGVTVDPSGEIKLPSTNDTTTTDKCLCKQSIIDAFDPCYLCGAEYNRTQDLFSTQKLVDSCNLRYQANVHVPGMAPGNSASSSKATSAIFLAAVAVVASIFTMA